VPKIIKTHLSSPTVLSGSERLWTYNGLDCCVTFEVFEALEGQLDNQTRSTYEFSKALQAPVLDMRLRGIAIDIAERDRLLDEYENDIEEYIETLEDIVVRGLGVYGFNWRQPRDLHNLFYEVLDLPHVRKHGRITADREALEKLEHYSIATPIVTLLKAIRDYDKRAQMLRTEIDHDGRMRTSFNIAGTDTGRFSSSMSEFGTGGNMQNIEDRLRRIFVADPKMKFAYLDAAQGESRCVGAIEWNLFHDGTYLDSCESGDLHTTVARLCWPDLGWTNELDADREIAEQPYYRNHSFRDMCKKLGHGTNYGGQPRTLSQQSRVDLAIVESFQGQYHEAFPAHRRWHRWVEKTLKEEGKITNLTGRRRQFWSRRDAADTIRAAIASDPQGSLSDIVNNGMLQVWRRQLGQLMLQCHDAVLVQYPEEQEGKIIPKLREALKFRLELEHGRDFIIPFDCKVGWNWAKYGKDNPDGLKDYTEGDKRRRQKKVSILDQRIRSPDREHRVTRRI
jgi:DNA polymerase-1